MKTLMACVVISLMAVEARAEKPTLLLAVYLEQDEPVRTWLREQGNRVVPIWQAHSVFDTAIFGIDEPIPSWVDGALRADWVEGSEACQAQVGPPPYAGNRKALYCGMDLAAALWQRHLERLAPEGSVLILKQSKDAKGWSMSGVTYRVDSAVQRELSVEVKSAETAGRDSVELSRRLLAGEGKSVPRRQVRELPEKPAGAAAPAAQVAQFPAVPLPPCARLPVTLRISPESNVGQALAARWKLSAKAAGASRAERVCELKYQAGAGGGGGLIMVEMVRAKASLVCEGDAFSVNVPGYTDSLALDAATKKLIEQAAKKWCE